MSEENRELLARLVSATQSPSVMFKPLQLSSRADSPAMPQEVTVLKSIRVFFSYSHKNEELRDELETHLALLKRQDIISTWHDRRIIPGHDYKGEIDDNLKQADVVLLLVSADFIASDYCYEVEMTTALDRHKNGEARVVPIILRKCDWHSAPFQNG